MSKIVKQLLILFVIIIVVFLILNYKIGFFSGNSTSQAGPMAAEPSAIPVAVEVIQPEILEQKVKVTGTLMANESVELKSEISGKITKIYFTEGQQINNGELLFSIDDTELQAQLEKLKSTQKLYEDNEYRQKKLLEREAISQEEYEVVLNELSTIQADIKVVESQINKSHIRAPFSGVIGLRQVSEGSYISPSTVIANFFSIQPIKIEFSVPGKYSTEIQKDQVISFTVESMGQEFQGRIYAIEPQIDPKTRTLKVRAISQNKSRQLMPGQFANIEIILETINDALMVPTISVIPELNGHKIFKYQNGKAVSVNVDIGQRSDQQVQIVKGINPSDTVLISGILQVRDGVPVMISSSN
ncbi:MAG: efflux RND transporter periplasmic adaptor subunit [Candidatus Cyclobacteriaceae bacterium M3_2C_046]